MAGVGNVLRGDDGFGVEVVRRLEQLDLPAGCSIVETGIAGIALVQELQEGWDALIVVDTVDRGRTPGTVMVIEPDVVDVTGLEPMARHDLLADMHLATPERAMMLARALGALPDQVLMVGCQPTDAHAVSDELTGAVASAVEVAVEEVSRLCAGMSAPEVTQ